MTDTPPGGPMTLANGWRERIPAQLDALAKAWGDPAAWQGMTRAGGIDMPGEIAALVTFDEVVPHGWDLATATGQTYEPDDATVAVVTGFLVESRKDEVPEELFGPVVEVPWRPRQPSTRRSVWPAATPGGPESQACRRTPAAIATSR
ncbi:MAG: TIGR03086 family metal-binding protein [Aeromicrobium sp.]